MNTTDTLDYTIIESPAEREERLAAQAGMWDDESAAGAWADVLYMDELADDVAEAMAAEFDRLHF